MTSVPTFADVRLHRCRCAMTSVPTSADVGFSVREGNSFYHGCRCRPMCPPPLCPSRVPSALVRQGWSIAVNVTPPLCPSRAPSGHRCRHRPMYIYHHMDVPVMTSVPMSADVRLHRYRCAMTSVPTSADVGCQWQRGQTPSTTSVPTSADVPSCRWYSNITICSIATDIGRC